MDEVFDSSLDGSGNEDFLKIIRFVIKGANIFVISHKEGMFDKFDNVIRFEKVKGFSRIMPSTVAAELWMFPTGGTIPRRKQSAVLNHNSCVKHVPDADSW